MWILTPGPSRKWVENRKGRGGAQILYDGGNVGEISATDACSYLTLSVVLTQTLTAAVPYMT